jgi:hypothetical protein
MCWECHEAKRKVAFYEAIFRRMADKMGSTRIPPGSAFIMAARAAIRADDYARTITRTGESDGSGKLHFVQRIKGVVL